MYVIAPLAGESPYFPQEEFAYPKPLIEILGRPMIELAIQNLSSIADVDKFVFVANSEEAKRYSYEKIFKILTKGNSELISISGKTAGALCSCLMAIDDIPYDKELIIANTDQIVTSGLAAAISKLRASDCDAGVVTFESVHPRWSYVDVDNGVVQRAAEKSVISKSAIAGIYYFKSAALFFKAAESALLKSHASTDPRYISSSLNELIIQGHSVASVEILSSDYHSFYHPKAIESFQMSQVEKTHSKSAELTVVIPAAGQGQRFFDAGFEKPKPFIDVLGVPMIDHVLNNMPDRDHTCVLLRSQHMHAEPDLVRRLQGKGVQIVEVENLTEGTACTLLLARQKFDRDGRLLVANSDQIVDSDLNDFILDCERRKLDGSILVFREPSGDPKWSYASIDANGLVTEVAEKKAISEYATVGIYLFTRGGDFVDGAADMIARNDRVNGEFYTCPVYNYLVAQGKRIGIYEIDRDAMHGVGTPADLAKFVTERGAAR